MVLNVVGDNHRVQLEIFSSFELQRIVDDLVADSGNVKKPQIFFLVDESKSCVHFGCRGLNTVTQPTDDIYHVQEHFFSLSKIFVPLIKKYVQALCF